MAGAESSGSPVPLGRRVGSPLGVILLVSDGQALCGLYLEGDRDVPVPELSAQARHPSAVLDEAQRQLDAYFAGALVSFSLPLAPVGTPFQLRVWRALCEIDYGETETYGEVAERIGHPRAARAVGAANGQNPISIVIPCHRLLGADGSLTGYGGGLAAKAWLLGHEAHGRHARAR